MNNIFKRKKHTGDKREIPSEKLAKVATTTIESLLKIADEYGNDRDEVCFIFAETLFESVLEGTFKYYEIGGNENE